MVKSRIRERAVRSQQFPHLPCHKLPRSRLVSFKTFPQRSKLPSELRIGAALDL
jgi:hypothetical protein